MFKIHTYLFTYVNTSATRISRRTKSPSKYIHLDKMFLIVFIAFPHLTNSIPILNQSISADEVHPVQNNKDVYNLVMMLGNFPRLQNIEISLFGQHNSPDRLENVQASIHSMVSRNTCFRLTSNRSEPLYTDLNSYQRLNNQRYPKLFITFETKNNYFTDLVTSSEFRIYRDILLIIVTNKTNNLDIFDGRYANLLPRNGFLYRLHSAEMFSLKPYKSRIIITWNNEPFSVKLVWVKIPTEKLQYNDARLLKGFDNAVLSLKDVNIFRASRRSKKPICANRRWLSPWIYNMDILIVCELVIRLNVTGRFFSTTNFTYKFPSFSFGALTKSLTPSDLFSTGHNTETGFLVPVELQGLDFDGILGPIGLPVFVWTILCSVGMAIFFNISVTIGNQVKACAKKVSAYALLELVIRAVLDQCRERLPLKNNFFRVALSPWLFYCLIISETYRGELVSYLVRPPMVDAPETFRLVN